MAVDRWSEMLALAACVTGLVVVALTWPRRQGDRTRSAGPRTETPAPILVKLDTIGDEPRWRVANRHGILNVSIDIVTYRPSGTDGPWTSEPIDQPIVLSPGRSTTLPSVVREPTLPHDVVVAWTIHHLGGDASHRRTFRVAAEPEVSVAPARVDVAAGPTRGLTVVYGVIAVLLLVTGTAAAWRLLGSSNRSSGVAALPGASTSTPAATTVAPPPPTSVPAVTAAMPATTAAPDRSTLAPATSATATSAPGTTTTTDSTTTTSTTSTVPLRRVTILGRIGPCRFGPDCLIASFRLAGFPREGNYVCEFGDGSRFTFRYEGAGADGACTASGRDPSITIEVDGVRSATITRESPTGA